MSNLVTPCSRWRHYNGAHYTVLYVTNLAIAREGHPPDVVYQGDNGSVWSRPLSDWHRSMTPAQTVGTLWLQAMGEVLSSDKHPAEIVDEAMQMVRDTLKSLTL